MPGPSHSPWIAFWTIGTMRGLAAAAAMIRRPRRSGKRVMMWSGPVTEIQAGTIQSRSPMCRSRLAALASSHGAWKATVSGVPALGAGRASHQARRSAWLTSRRVSWASWPRSRTGGRSTVNGSGVPAAVDAIEVTNSPIAEQISRTNAVTAIPKRRRRRPLGSWKTARSTMKERDHRPPQFVFGIGLTATEMNAR